MPINPATLTPEQLQELVKSAQRIQAPTFYAASAVVQFAGNDGSIMLMRPQMATIPPNGEPAPFALTEVVAVIHMSVATMKDLSLLLNDQIDKMENKIGKSIETEYTRTLINK